MATLKARLTDSDGIADGSPNSDGIDDSSLNLDDIKDGINDHR